MTLVRQLNMLENLNVSEKIKTFISHCLQSGIPIEEIGYKFEKTKLENNEKKKKHGQFYTPQHIVEYMIHYLSLDENMTIIDPASGTGSFLIPILKKLHLNKTTHSIYGIDIDGEALDVLYATIKLLGLHIDQGHLINGNTIVKNKNMCEKALNVDEIRKSERFDVVIGNPPFVTMKKNIDYDPADTDYKGLLVGQVNAATLMIAKGLKMLKSGGKLAFVLPKNLLHVQSYSALRAYLLKNTTIIHVVDLRSSFKDVKGEQIILFIEKKRPKDTHKVDITVFTDKQFEKKSVFVKQKNFMKENKIYTFEREVDYQLIDRLTNTGVPLNEIVDKSISRGLPVKKSNIINEKLSDNYIPYIRGRNIKKFKVVPELYVKKDIIMQERTERVKTILNKKIVVQNIFSSESGIISSYDADGVLTNETVTNIIINDEQLSYYVLGLLNSKIANYFLIYACYNCSKMTMHTDRQYIGSIPVVIPEDENVMMEVIHLVQQLSDEFYDSPKLKAKLDELLYDIYHIEQHEIEIINSALNMFLSERSRW